MRCRVPLDLSLGTWQVLLLSRSAVVRALVGSRRTFFLADQRLRAMRLLLLLPLAMAANVTEVSTSLGMEHQDAASLTGVTKNSPGDLTLGVALRHSSSISSCRNY